MIISAAYNKLFSWYKIPNPMYKSDTIIMRGERYGNKKSPSSRI